MVVADKRRADGTFAPEPVGLPQMTPPRLDAAADADAAALHSDTSPSTSGSPSGSPSGSGKEKRRQSKMSQRMAAWLDEGSGGGVISERHFQQLQRAAEDWNVACAVKACSEAQLMAVLDLVLAREQGEGEEEEEGGDGRKGEGAEGGEGAGWRESPSAERK